VTEPAAAYFQGKILSCAQFNDAKCYQLVPGALSWTEISSIPIDAVMRASVAGDRIVFSGGMEGSSDPQLVVYYDDQGLFIPGPTLPARMSHHCQLTINQTHVFFSGDETLLLNVETDQFTFLENVPRPMSTPACGLLNGMNGKEILMAVTTKSYIFNLNDTAWRPGPQLPEDIEYLAYAQVSGGFLAIGGEGEKYDIATGFPYSVPIDTIYKFDENMYEWILLPQKLELAREETGAVSVPEDFWSC